MYMSSTKNYSGNKACLRYNKKRASKSSKRAQL